MQVSEIVFACHAAACSPPPVGTGGSNAGKGGGKADTTGGLRRGQSKSVSGQFTGKKPARVTRLKNGSQYSVSGLGDGKTHYHKSFQDAERHVKTGRFDGGKGQAGMKLQVG